MGFSKIGIAAKVHDERCQAVASELVAWLASTGYQPLYNEHLARHIGKSDGISDEELAKRAEVVVVLGGDGTLISTARLLHGRAIPIVGVNLGSLGFLTEVTLEEMYQVLARCLAGNASLSERLMLDVVARRGEEELLRCSCLNDVVINKGAISRIIDIEARVDRKLLTTYKADGVIISTPTGSTGYCMSAGGPIIHPELECLVVVPICPHALTNRPIAIPANRVLHLKVVSSFDENVFLTCDGQVGCELQQGDIVTVSRSLLAVRLVKPETRDYFEVLRTKLHWGER